MAGQATAHPRGTFANWQALAMGITNFKSLTRTRPKRALTYALQLAAFVHLLTLALFEISPGSASLKPLLILTGLALVLLAILQCARPSTSPADTLSLMPDPAPEFAVEPVGPTPPAIPNISCQANLAAHAFSLEVQSQRLVEIADVATRRNREAERRGQAWADLMAQVSHELRTPLNAVIGFSDVMTAELFGPVGHPRYREYVDHIRDSGRALLKCAEDTLVLTQILARPEKAAPPIPVDLRSLAAATWHACASEANTHAIDLEINVEDGLELLADVRLLRQILANLFTETLSRAGENATIEFSAHAADDLAEIEIKLSGTAADHAPGETSLSLSLARAFLELQDAFLVELPASPKEWRVATMLSLAAQPDFFKPAGEEHTATGKLC